MVGMWLAGDLWRWEAVPILLWLKYAFKLLIYGVNDVFDQETDAQNPRKGTLEGAKIDRSEVRPIALGVIVSNVPFLIYFTIFLPPSAVAWMLLYALLFVGYSVPPARFKARPYLDSLSNAAYAFPLVFVPLGLGEGPVWPAAIGLMAWSAAKHTFDAVQDVDEDRKVGITTTAVRLSPGGVVLWSGAFWALATVCFALVNVPVAVVGGGLGGLASAALLGRAGHEVMLLEANPWLGGKSRRIELDGRRVDTGPSLLTFPGVWEEFMRRWDTAGGNP